MANNGCVTLNLWGRLPSNLSLAKFAPCLTILLAAIYSPAFGQAPSSDGSIFFEDFDGAGDFTDADPDWDQIGYTHYGPGANATLNGDSTMTFTMPGDGQVVSFAGSRLLDFSSTPNEWVASTRFKTDGSISSLHRDADGSAQREISLLRGAPSGVPAGGGFPTNAPSRAEPIDGFDLRLNVDRETPNSTESGNIIFTSGGTFELGWHGHNGGVQDRRSEDIGAGGDIFVENTWYTVTAHRRPDNIVDIWVDDTLLGSKPLLNDKNPAALFIGLDNESQEMPGLIYDFVSIGASSAAGPPPTRFTWGTNDLGDWNLHTNWTPSGGPPGSLSRAANTTAVFPDTFNITGPTTVVTNSAVTVNRVEFDNVMNTYVVAGFGSVNMVATTDKAAEDPTMTVQGTHKFQAAVNLQNNTAIDVGSDSKLTFDGALSLMGNTLSKIGVGTMAVNNKQIFGAVGSLDVREGTLAGDGTVGGSVDNSATIAPGNSTGVLTVNGDLNNSAAGTILMEIEGTDGAGRAQGHDQIQVTGSSTLAGTLDIQTGGNYADPTTRALRDEFTLIASAGGNTGTFTTVNYNGTALSADFNGPDGSFRDHIADGLFRNVNYDANNVSVTNLLALEGDADGDIDIDITDFNILASNFDDTGANAATNDWTTADFDADGDIDITDFNFLAANFADTGYGGSVSGQVPEPSGIALLLLGLLGVGSYRLCRRSPGEQRRSNLPAAKFAASLTIVLAAICSPAFGQAPVSDGSIFFEDFDGGPGPFDDSRPEWDQVGFTHCCNDGTHMTLNGDSTVTFKQDGQGGEVSFAASRLLDFSSTPGEWVAATRFRTDGSIIALHRDGDGSAQREFSLLRGAPSGPASNPVPSRNDPTDGFHLTLDVDADTPNSTSSGNIFYRSGGTFELGWLGHNGVNSGRRSEDIGAGGDIFDENTFYTVTVHRKPNNTVDIWVDDTIVGNMPLLNDMNPAAVFLGLDNESQLIPGVVYDFVSIGAAGDPPPPPTTFTWGTNNLGNWNNSLNWTPSGGPPRAGNHTAVFPDSDSITGPTTVVTNSALTVNRIEFDNATNTYVVAGFGSVHLMASTADPVVEPTMSVQGTHIFQTPANLHENTEINVSNSSLLTFDGELNLMGNTLTMTGGGTMAVNNKLSLGSGGKLEILEGTLAGNGILDGSVHNDGTIAPGSGQVPEPTSIALLLLGLLGVGYFRLGRKTN